MPADRMSSEEIAKRALELYEQNIRALVEPDHKGEFLVIDIDTGAYEMDTDAVVASSRARERSPLGTRFLIRVGYPTAFRLGGRFAPGRRL